MQNQYAFNSMHMNSKSSKRLLTLPLYKMNFKPTQPQTPLHTVHLISSSALKCSFIRTRKVRVNGAAVCVCVCASSGIFLLVLEVFIAN